MALNILMRINADKATISKVVQRLEKDSLKASIITEDEIVIINILDYELDSKSDALIAELDKMEGVAKAILIRSQPKIDKIVHLSKPYKLSSRQYREEVKPISVSGVTIGKDFVIVAGPCSVEEETVTLKIASMAKDAGANIFRGGAYKPRTNAYSNQGLGLKGLKILAKVKEETGLPVITEVMEPELVDQVAEYTDILQIGMRSMQNFPLLKRVGKTQKPVLLKRGDSATVSEWLQAADYILKEGNENVMLCERGIKTFDSCMRNTFDMNALAIAKKESCLPVIADPSHGAGRRDIVYPLSLAAAAAGADGLLIEAHYSPDEAVSDSKQTISIQTLRKLISACHQVHELCKSQ